MGSLPSNSRSVSFSEENLDQFASDCAEVAETATLDTSRVNSVIARIAAHYNEPHRRYHNMVHVQAVVDRVTVLAADNSLSGFHTAHLRLAAWFHDVIYNPTAHDNESLSAKFAQTELTSMGVEPHQTERIAALINMTAGHDPADDVAAVLLDADLWTLGGSEQDYFIYGALIREEYSQVSDAQWQIGRARFIETFLNRPRIFHTPAGLQQREVQARRNLAIELDRLTN
jgi:predicted metal-dependent HD superfamily phosphohydrolase